MRILLPGEFYYAKIKDKTEGEFKVHTYLDCCKKKKMPFGIKGHWDEKPQEGNFFSKTVCG